MHHIRQPSSRRTSLPACFCRLPLVLLAMAARTGVDQPSDRPPQQAPSTSSGWRLTVYHTPVESYHGGPQEAITGCQGEDMGRHSHEFLAKVQTEGFGKLSTPGARRAYLSWDFDRECWSLPVGANDQPQRPWVSIAAHPSIAIGTRLSIRDCGSHLDRSVCDRVLAAAWVVHDRYSVGCSGPKQLDLYIGEEDRPNFEDDNPNYFEARNATVTLNR